MLLMCLGVCVPLAVRTCGNWGGEAQGTFSTLLAVQATGYS